MALGFGTPLCSPKSPCPCGSGLVYGSCCGPLHWARTSAETAEQLMRSRYTAFALGDVDYLIATHLDPATPLERRRRELLNSCRKTRWLGLEIEAVEAGGIKDIEGTVAFKASFSEGGHRRCFQEVSLFERRSRDLKGEWLYLRALAPSQ